ncbi:ABC-2 family transporter protein [Planctomycetes bacterium Pla163]|uniref:ABC-2 family transporter protein n=1 Tax=Rohdeia mirabilis TaxID=2528008 RepID=A0A518CWN8_9BACT|nr:ABC-2 family transporter protein [Planctomycetes bacterium Pla163]
MNALDHTNTDFDDPNVSRGAIYRALVRDAYLQVIDNAVFKVLLGLVLLMVALTFVIGFRQDGVEVLFGMFKYDYEQFLGTFGFAFGVIGGDNTNETIVRAIQNLFTTVISGSFGALFAVVATSFFLPRMLERGSADTLFSKPVSRGALVVSRYLASLIFVSLLTVVLVLGMYLGFAVSSGYTNPEFLWSGPMLIYLFAILSAFSTFWGAMTRSSIATLLLTVLSWWGCVGVHGGWLIWEFVEHNERVDSSIDGARFDDPTLATDTAASDEYGPVVSVVRGVVEGLHYALPKTGDAAQLTELVRKTLHGEIRTLVGGVNMRNQMLQVYEQADGAYVVVSPDGSEALYPDARGTDIETGGRRPLFLRIGEDGSLEAWVPTSMRDMRRGREEAEEAEAAGSDGEADGETAGDETAAWPPSWTEPTDIVPPDEIDFGLEDPATFLQRRFVWGQSDWGFSPIFSFLSSLLSSAVLVLLAIWRVRRIDF